MSSAIPPPRLDVLANRAHEDGQEPATTAGGDHIGHHAARILYHFSGGESQHAELVRGQEQRALAGEQERQDVLALEERVIPAGGVRVALDRRPEILDERHRAAVGADHFGAQPVFSVPSVSFT